MSKWHRRDDQRLSPRLQIPRFESRAFVSPSKSALSDSSLVCMPRRNGQTEASFGTQWKKMRKPRTADWQESLLLLCPLRWEKPSGKICWRNLSKRTINEQIFQFAQIKMPFVHVAKTNVGICSSIWRQNCAVSQICSFIEREFCCRRNVRRCLHSRYRRTQPPCPHPGYRAAPG